MIRDISQEKNEVNYIFSFKTNVFDSRTAPLVFNAALQEARFIFLAEAADNSITDYKIRCRGFRQLSEEYNANQTGWMDRFGKAHIDDYGRIFYNRSWWEWSDGE